VEGGLIKRAWIKHYTKKDRCLEIPDYIIDPKNCIRFCTVDPAITEKDLESAIDPDYTVMAAWAIFHSTRGPLLFLLDLIRERMEGPKIVEAMKAFHAHHEFSVIGVETIAFQKMLAQYARKEGLPIREIGQKEDCIYRIDKDKFSRALSATPFMAAGQFYVPTYAPWLADYISELVVFPNASHDDCVDVTAYGVAIAQKLRAMIKEDKERSAPISSDDGVNRGEPAPTDERAEWKEAMGL
jgi:predicted phage terminase large subunit-like protein